MVNTYISDVFFNMDHGSEKHGSMDDQYPFMTENAEMLISMLTELDSDSCHIPTVEELKADYFSRF